MFDWLIKHQMGKIASQNFRQWRNNCYAYIGFEGNHKIDGDKEALTRITLFNGTVARNKLRNFKCGLFAVFFLACFFAVLIKPLSLLAAEETVTKPSTFEQWYYIAPESKPLYSQFFDKLKLQLPELQLKRLSTEQIQRCDFSKSTSHFITAGIKSLKLVKNCVVETPVFAFYLTQQQFQITSKKDPERYKNTNVLFVDQPLIRQIALSDYFLPKENNIGILYSPSVKQQIIVLNKVIPKKFRVDSRELSNPKGMLKQLSKITKSSDLILALIDSHIFNSANAKTILMTTYRPGKPLFGGTRGFVKAGIVASCYSNPGRLVDELIEILKHPENISGVRQYPKHFEIIQNPAVARSLNLIPVKDEILKQIVLEKLLAWSIEK